jgi:hypothetical protein
MHRVTGPDGIMAQVAEGIAAGRRGERELARSILGELWVRVERGEGDAVHRCAIAHSLADVQDDAGAELTWDRRALAAADEVTDEHLAAVGSPGTAKGLYPSLHLNLADVHARLGHPDQARDHVRRGREALGALPDDGYRAMIRDALTRLADELDGG